MRAKLNLKESNGEKLRSGQQWSAVAGRACHLNRTITVAKLASRQYQSQSIAHLGAWLLLQSTDPAHLHHLTVDFECDDHAGHNRIKAWLASPAGHPLRQHARDWMIADGSFAEVLALETPAGETVEPMAIPYP